MSTPERTRSSQAETHWAAGRIAEALHHAWAAYRTDPHDAETKAVLADLIGKFPFLVVAQMRGDVLALLQDPDVAPDTLSAAGWLLMAQEPWWNVAADDAQCETLAAGLDRDPLAFALLRESPVHDRTSERVLMRLRRWLLLSQSWPRYPQLWDGLVQQAGLNGGAWPFTDVERQTLSDAQPHPMLAAYLPSRPESAGSRPAEFTDSVTRAVAEGYESWPFPPWRRIMAFTRTYRLPDEIRALDPGGPDCLPVNARILIAGCGTGSEVAQVMRKYPDATITAIDVSEASLNYAKERWMALGLPDVRFLQLDLHRVSELNERFDAIFCSGVLHHLPDPERGWAALAGALRPGGVMRIMLYSRTAHAWIEQAKMLVRDLAARPLDDDVLRAVRQRFLEGPDTNLTRQVMGCSGFSTLGGTHDLLLHRRDDLFDVPRIARALERLRLRLVAFVLPNPAACARYDAMFPHDRRNRDMQSWAIFERHNPQVFIGMYDFWCRSDAFWFAASPGPRLSS